MMKLFRIAVPVSDINAAAQFYETLLGVAGRDVRGVRSYFDCGGVIVALVQSGKPPLSEIVYFAVDDLDAVFERASSLGCLSTESIHGEPGGAIVRRPWGELSFYAVDPFGNRLCFADSSTLFTG